MKTDCDRQACPYSLDSREVLTSSQEGEGFIADEDDEEDEIAERKRKRRKRKKNREEEEALDDEDLDLIGVEVERPAEEQVRHAVLKCRHR
jgi:transcription elongation factor SPT6